MGLKDYKPKRHEIKIEGEVIAEVRGLTLVDFSTLIHTHLPDLDALFDLFTKGGDINQTDFETLAMGVVTDAPGFAANLIAIAADDPEGGPAAMTLPAFTQIETLKKIAELTFVDVGGPKKGMEMIASLLKNMPKKAALLKTTGKPK